MADLTDALQSVFRRWLATPAPSLGSIRELRAFDLPPVDATAPLHPDNFHLLERRSVIDTALLPEIRDELAKWDETTTVGEVLAAEPDLRDLPPAFVREQMPERLIRQVILEYLDTTELTPKSSHFQSDGLWYARFDLPVFDDRVLETCQTIAAVYRASFARAKVCTICAPLHGLQVLPSQAALAINPTTSVRHISTIPSEIILRLRSGYRNSAIRSVADYGYCLVHEFTSALDSHRSTYGNGREVNELVRRFVTSLRLIEPGWVAAPLAVEYSNLPWQEPREYPLNQNLPWGGFYTLRPTAADAVHKYWTALGDPALARLTDDHRATSNFAYLIWALQQLENLATVTSDASRASHLFIAIEALFGKDRNSQAMWKSIPLRLFHSDSEGHVILGDVMGVAYDCRSDLFHNGVTPPKRFYQRHFDYLTRVVIETAKWILDNRAEPSLATKDGFLAHVRADRGPHNIRAMLTKKLFSPRLE